LTEAAAGRLESNHAVLLLRADVIGALASLSAFAFQTELATSCSDPAVAD
jgi:hypothetical protein